MTRVPPRLPRKGGSASSPSIRVKVRVRVGDRVWARVGVRVRVRVRPRKGVVPLHCLPAGK